MYMQIMTGRYSEVFGMNTVYRFLNSVKTNWEQMTCALSVRIINRSIRKLTSEDRKDSNDKYRHILWQCQNRFKKGAPCKNRYFRENEMPELMNTMFIAVTNRYPEIKRNTLDVVEDVIGTERMKDIQKFISHLPADKLKTDPAEWAMLIENSTVYDKTLKVRLFGGLEMIIRR